MGVSSTFSVSPQLDITRPFEWRSMVCFKFFLLSAVFRLRLVARMVTQPHWNPRYSWRDRNSYTLVNIEFHVSIGSRTVTSRWQVYTFAVHNYSLDTFYLPQPYHGINYSLRCFRTDNIFQNRGNKALVTSELQAFMGGSCSFHQMKTFAFAYH